MDEMVTDKFPAPNASQVCYKEQHGRNPNQPPSLWETKLHVTIVDDSFSFLYSYNMETEFAAFYQNCTTYEKGQSLEVQYNGSNDDLDWRIDFRYPNFISIIKYLRSRLIKGCFIE